MGEILARVKARWGENPPDWVICLAERCEATSQSDVARAIARSPALVNQVLGRKYAGDMGAVERLVRGKFMDARLNCPHLGAIGLDVCESWQAKSVNFQPTSHLRVVMHRTCKACAHNKRVHHG